jgi:predicted MFS family arabinose efflux permease
VGAVVFLMLWLLSLKSGIIWQYAAAAIPLWALFVWREARVPAPFVDLRRIAASRRLAFTFARNFITYVAFYTVFYGLPQWLQSTGGFDTAATGLLLAPLFAVGVLSTLVATQLGRRLAPRALVITGSAGLAAGGAFLAFFLRPEPSWQIALAGAALLGIPTGFNNMGNQLALHAESRVSEIGSNTGMFRTVQHVGAAISSVVVAYALGGPSADGGIRSLSLVVAGIGMLLLLLGVAAAIAARRRVTR